MNPWSEEVGFAPEVAARRPIRDRGLSPGESPAGGRPRPEAGEMLVLRPGRISYASGLALQERLVAERRLGTAPDTLVLLEHEAVVTLGRGANPTHVLLDRERLERKGIDLFETGRGGDVTLHSPGQVVGYPVLALHGAQRDSHLYLRDLEEVMIRTAASYGVVAERVAGLTGIWVSGDKLGAIGVRMNSGWITSHGFAFNVSNDLALFDVIVPCGIRGRGVTSLSKLLSREVPVTEVMDVFESFFREVFHRGGATDLVDDPSTTANTGAPARLSRTKARRSGWRKLQAAHTAVKTGEGE